MAGGGQASSQIGGYGGGLIGGANGTSRGGTQTSGHSFGAGQPGASGLSYSGAGGGYYGGWIGTTSAYAAGGGSSFISGHNGSNAITSSTDRTHTGQANHYSGRIFANTAIIDGAGYNWTDIRDAYVGVPNYSTGALAAGNSGNGYARIKLLSLNE